MSPFQSSPVVSWRRLASAGRALSYSCRVRKWCLNAIRTSCSLETRDAPACRVAGGTRRSGGTPSVCVSSLLVASHTKETTLALSVCLSVCLSVSHSLSPPLSHTFGRTKFKNCKVISHIYNKNVQSFYNFWLKNSIF